MINFQENISLKEKTSFNIGGLAKYFATVSTREELIEAYKFSKDKNLPIFVLGDGTDILLSDQQFNVVAIKFDNKDFVASQIDNHKYEVTAGAGLNWDKFVESAVLQNLGGVECLSGIPGTTGAAPVQNIGAYGQEIKDTLKSVEVFDSKSGEFKVFKNEDCEFGYRDSIFKKEKGRYFIFSVTLVLEKGSNPTLTYASLLSYLNEKNIKNPGLVEVRNAVLDIRAKKLENPKNVGNAGSFFKNPVITKEEFSKLEEKFGLIPNFVSGEKIKLQAGWLIDKAGWKGKSVGGAMVSTKNALVLVNANGNAKASEVKTLAAEIVDDIKNKFGVTLEPEVQFINF